MRFIHRLPPYLSSDNFLIVKWGGKGNYVCVRKQVYFNDIPLSVLQSLIGAIF